MRSDVLYLASWHGWEQRWHWYQGIAESLARNRRVLYMSTLMQWPTRTDLLAGGFRRPEGLSDAGERRAGCWVDRPRPNLTVAWPAVPRGRGAVFDRLRHRRAARAALRMSREMGFDPGTLLVWCYRPVDLVTLRRFPQARAVYLTADVVTDPGEPELLERVDLVLCASPVALERNRRAVGGRAVRVPMPMRPEPFAQARESGAVPDDVRGLPRPIAGYVGECNFRLDFEVLEAVADRFRGTVLLIGPATDDDVRRRLERLAQRSNVWWYGPRPFARVPDYVASFDVGLVPYRRSPFNDGSNPIKFYEYLAAGLPVVSTDLPSLREYPDFSVRSDDPGDFADLVVRESERSLTEAEVIGRRKIAESSSYERFVERVDALLDEGAFGKP